MTAHPTPSIKTKDVVVTRVFDAPVDLVWKAWTDPKLVMRWWGPNYFSSPSCKMDFRVGGTTIACMRSPDGQDFYNTWAYTKIVPLQRIEYIQNLSDEAGNRIDPVSVGLRGDFPQDVRTVVTFRALGSKTEVSVIEYGFPDSQMFEFAVMGLNQCLDKMGAIFARTRITAEPGQPAVVITRDFDAPVELVFKAFTDPALYIRWLGPRRLTMRLETFEPRSGGRYRYVHKGEDGTEHFFHGVYHEVLAPARIISTFEYEGLPEAGHVALDTYTFEGLHGGRTRMTSISVFQSVADRDAMMQSGMEEGVYDSHERLDELLSEMQR